MPPSRSTTTPMTLTKDDCIFFWKTTHINGWGSQWYPSSFEATVEIDEGVVEKVRLPTAEHWMMLQKALLFGDKEIARKVIDVTESSNQQMRYVKSLGRKVKNFDEWRWKKERERIVLEGNMLKFEQNEELKKKLLDTGEKIIVEASPTDKIWGIGMGEAKAVRVDRSQWGMNLLGKALMSTRKAIASESNSDK
jgi:ribA/ribD-fused uncharacterized protein